MSRRASNAAEAALPRETSAIAAIASAGGGWSTAAPTSSAISVIPRGGSAISAPKGRPSGARVGTTSSARPLGAAPATNVASASAAVLSSRNRQSGRVRARVSIDSASAAMRDSTARRASSLSDFEIAPRKRSRPATSPRQKSMPASAPAAAATAASRAAASNSVRLPEPGAPTSASAEAGAVPSARRSNRARSDARSLLRPTRRPASGSPSGYGSCRSSSVGVAAPAPRRITSRSARRALAGRSAGSAASRRAKSASQPAPSPGRTDESGGGGSASTRSAARRPRPNGGAPLQAS